MKCNSLLVAELSILARSGVLLVLATDNMDCFFETVDNIDRLNALFDCVLCSSSLGVLKGENPEKFFGDWLDANGFRPNQAFLLDDSAKNCQAFQRMGGNAEIVSSPHGAVEILRKWREEIALTTK